LLSRGTGARRKKGIEFRDRTEGSWRVAPAQESGVTPHVALRYALLKFAQSPKNDRSAARIDHAPFVGLGGYDVAWVDTKLVSTFGTTHHRPSLGNERVVELVFNATAGATNVHEYLGIPAAW
jgi:hypothetical protein